MKTNIPKSLEATNLNQLDISVRSHNALRSRRISTLGELLRLSDRELLKTNALGRKSLEDIRAAVSKFLLANGVSELPSSATGHNSEPREWPSTENERTISPGGWLVPQGARTDLDVSIDLVDLSTRARNVLTQCKVCTVRELLSFPKKNLFAAENFGRKTLAEIESKLLHFLSAKKSLLQIENRSYVTVGSEGPLSIKAFVEQILSHLPEKQKMVVADRYGLWDGIAETLQDIGDKWGLTRERIRQIEAKSIKRIHRLYGHGAIKEFLNGRILPYFSSAQDDACGVLSEGELMEILAGKDSSEESVLAVGFLQDIDSPGQAILSRYFMEVEPGIYATTHDATSRYREVFSWIERSLEGKAKPLTEETLLQEVVKTACKDLTPRQMRIASRILSVSPRISLLPNGMVTLSHWRGSVPRTVQMAAEAILKSIGRPAHFREIAQKAVQHFKSMKGITDKSIHCGILAGRDTFVWVKPGTYGLIAWGLTKPPFIKDKLCELLAEAHYPLPYWHIEEKVLEVCNCKPASVRMTLELNHKLFRKFDGDQFGLARHFG